MRVLFVDTGVGFAGGQAGLVELLKNLDASNFAPVVASPAASAVGEKCREMGLDWRVLPFASVSLARGGEAGSLGRLGDLGSSLYGVVYLAGLMRRLKIDLVHANTFKAALVSGLACLFSGRPMVFHDRTQIKRGLLGRLVELLSARIIVISRAVAGKHTARAAPKTRLVYDGVDTVHFTPRSLGPPGVVAGYLGRISEEKGLDLLVECARAVLELVPRARFAIGGRPFTAEDVAYFDRVRLRVAELGLEQSFHFAGEVGDVRAFLEGISLLVMPSRWEGLGIVALEAMALERPVVAFRTGGIAEVVSDGQTGVLVSPGDKDGLARSIANLLADKDAARLMGQKGRERVLERFTGKIMGENIIRIYFEIADGRGR